MTVQDAVILYFALHGTDAPLKCMHIDDRELEPTQLSPSSCGKTLAGISYDDGAPLCANHLQSEGGHRLSDDVLAELWLVKRTWERIRDERDRVRRWSELEKFALRVAGIDLRLDSETIPAPNDIHAEESKTRGHIR